MCEKVHVRGSVCEKVGVRGSVCEKVHVRGSVCEKVHVRGSAWYNYSCMYEYVESDPLLRPKATIHIFKKVLVTVSL